MEPIDPRSIIYKRKSSDSEDRQILSLGSQDRVMREATPGFNSLKITADYEESMSAKAPGRPKFNEMCEKLEAGEARNIICWQLNRLARNPVDGGRILWLVQNYGVRIITPSKTYDASDNLLMQIEFAMSNQFILDLKKATSRGIEDKLRAGIAPFLATLGYYNDVTKKQGLRDILPDPLRFSLVRKMWDLLLTGNYNPLKILEIATNEWGLRQRNGKPLSESKIYYLFTNPFYMGQFSYKGEIYQGSHQPMVTPEEFERAQVILGIRGKPRQKVHDFPFTNWIKCTCDSAITAHERYRKICPQCHHKYNALTNEFCPKCQAPAPIKTWYGCLYHCSRKKDPTCKQPSINSKDLTTQIDKILAGITIPQSFADLVLKQLRETNDEEAANRQAIVANLQNSLNAVIKKSDNLLYKYLSDENHNGELINDEEFKRQKVALISEKANLENQLKSMSITQDSWMDTAERVFNFAVNARHWFSRGKEEKRTIARALGLNPILDNKILRLELIKPLESIAEIVPLDEKAIKRIEPAVLVSATSKNPNLVDTKERWGDRWGLNPQHPPSQGGALPLSYGHRGTPGGTRTHNTRLKRAVL